LTVTYSSLVVLCEYKQLQGKDLVMECDVNLPTAGRPWDEMEFDNLFRTHYAPVYRALYRIVGTRQQAEDLAQETFLRLYRHRFSEHRTHNLRAWLFRVATNLGYNSLRGNRRRQDREDGLATSGSNGHNQGVDPATITLRNDERETVRQILGSLTLRQSQLLLLRHAGLSYREVAEVLSISPGSVGTLLARAEAAFEAAYRTLVVNDEEKEVMEHEGA
jgi:RNA polymerase sigma-70 factor, ECF subfamily